MVDAILGTVAAEPAGFTVGLGAAVVLALLLCVGRAVLDAIDDRHIEVEPDPDRHASITRHVELHDGGAL